MSAPTPRQSRRAIPPWLRFVFGLPRHLYARGWGWVLGHRFLQLSHPGRRTGVVHHTVLEVVRYDRDTGEAFVVSGLGPRSDWLLNLRAGGTPVISISRHSAPAAFREVDLDEAAEVLAAYENRHPLLRPLVRRALGALVGWRYDGSPAARRALAEQLPMIAFRPRRAGG